MTYKTKLSAREEAVIQEYLDRLSTRSEGESIILKGSPRELDILRRLFYNYFYINQLKSLYKITRRSPNYLEIIRRPHLQSIMEVDSHNISEGEQFTIDNLLEVTNEDEAMKLIERSGLSLPEQTRAIDEWQWLQKGKK